MRGSWCEVVWRACASVRAWVQHLRWRKHGAWAPAWILWGGRVPVSWQWGSWPWPWRPQWGVVWLLFFVDQGGVFVSEEQWEGQRSGAIVLVHDRPGSTIVFCAGVIPSKPIQLILVGLPIFQGHLDTGDFLFQGRGYFGKPNMEYQGFFFIGTPIFDHSHDLVRWSTVGLPDVLSHERMRTHFRQHGISRRGPPPRKLSGLKPR